nr:hypothetical protein [Saprospira grandis]
MFFWGLLPAAGATLRGSQVCSALQASLRFAFGLAFGHPSASLGQMEVLRFLFPPKYFVPKGPSPSQTIVPIAQAP